MNTDWSARTAAIPYFEKLVRRLKSVNDDDKELYEAALHALLRSQDHTAIQTRLQERTKLLRWAIDYVESANEELKAAHFHHGSGKVEPEDIAAEVSEVEAWVTKTRAELEPVR